MEDNRYSRDVAKQEDNSTEKAPLWKKFGVFFGALLMAIVTVVIMNI